MHEKPQTLGPVMLDIEGTELSAEERELLVHPAVGGVILFSRNYLAPEPLGRLAREIHRLREPKLLLAVDQEGGRVQRFREGFTALPPAAAYGRLYARDAQRAREAAELGGWLMAAELRVCGLDFSFAPVLDLDRGLNQVIGDRAFEHRPLVVADLARAWYRGMHGAGMAGVGKHFPGHGGVSADSHEELPVDPRPLRDLLMDDLVPFERLVDAGMEAVMPAHVLYPAADPHPAGFSSFWLRDVLRGRLGFQGMIFSDDLSMAAAGAAGDPPERAHQALEAGCDMVLVCNDRKAAVQVLEALVDHRDPAAHLRYLRMHGRRPPADDRAGLMGDPRWRRALQVLDGLTREFGTRPPAEADLFPRA